MGRPPKQGIDYAGWSVTVFDGDKKIDKLLDAQGWKGFGVYFFLCQTAYKVNGYYLEWSYDDSATTARKMGGGVGSETVSQTVNLCLQIGLFDGRLFDRWSVLTSKGIQRRFWAAAGERRVVPLHKEIWLLAPEEAVGLGSHARFVSLQPTNTSLQPTNPDLFASNDHKSKVNKDSCSSSSNARARGMLFDGEFGRVMAYYQDHINATPSTACTGELKAYTESLSADVVLHALEIALDERKPQWSYIQGILRRYAKDGLNTLGRVQLAESEYNAARERRETRNGNGGGFSPKAVVRDTGNGSGGIGNHSKWAGKLKRESLDG